MEIAKNSPDRLSEACSSAPANPPVEDAARNHDVIIGFGVAPAWPGRVESTPVGAFHVSIPANPLRRPQDASPSLPQSGTDQAENCTVDSGETHAVVAEAYAVPLSNDETVRAAAIPYGVPATPNALLARDDVQSDVVDSILSADGRGAASGGGIRLPPRTFTVISGMGGLGKTTMGALVLQNPSVRGSFPDGIAWVHLGSQKLTPLAYRDHLLTICLHLALTNQEALQGVKTSLEGFAFANEDDESVVEGDFRRLKALFAPFVVKMGVLLVLDDVWHQEDMNRFYFGRAHGSPNSILVTTRKRTIVDGLESMSSIIDLDLPSSSEALELLEKVACRELRSDTNAQELVKLCGNLPLAVSSVGLLIRGNDFIEPMSVHKALAFFSHGVVEGEVGVGAVNSSRTCFHVFDKTFDAFGESAEALRICFSIFCACFTCERGSRPSIPRGAIRCLFDEMLTEGAFITKEQRLTLLSDCARDNRDAAFLIVGKLRSVGLLEEHCLEDNPDIQMLRTHHDLQQEYGMRVAADLEQALRSRGKSSRNNSPIIAQANALLVRGYERRAKRGRQSSASLKKKDYDWGGVMGDDRRYMLDNLVRHMLLAYHETDASKLLRNKSFVQGRVETMGPMLASDKICEEIRWINHGGIGRHKGFRSWRTRLMSVLKPRQILEEALVSYIITQASRDGSPVSWLAADEARHKGMFIQTEGLIRSVDTYFNKFSIGAKLNRSFRARHAKKLHEQFVAANYDDNPFALHWKAAEHMWRLEFADSLKTHRRALAAKREALGDDHISLAYTIAYIMYIYMILGKYEEGIAYGKEGLRIFEKNFGNSNNIHVAAVRFWIGEFYWRLGEFETAREHFEDSSAMHGALGHQEMVAFISSERMV